MCQIPALQALHGASFKLISNRGNKNRRAPHEPCSISLANTTFTHIISPTRRNCAHQSITKSGSRECQRRAPLSTNPCSYRAQYYPQSKVLHPKPGPNISGQPLIKPCLVLVLGVGGVCLRVGLGPMVPLQASRKPRTRAILGFCELGSRPTNQSPNFGGFA